jgi:hypothetical protein
MRWLLKWLMMLQSLPPAHLKYVPACLCALTASIEKRWLKLLLFLSVVSLDVLVSWNLE